MTSNMHDKTEHGIMDFAALKTAIANGEEQSVRELLPSEPIQELEKGYLIDLAELNNDRAIIEILQGIPTTR
ncbi:hypothetical protein [Paraglaciecola chathamensis]|uniref:Uncharacterized protein n=1 Tax=Paraglaciecola agarilytica NO2 TaxID=1125747 RepID=A0ABQ0IAR1_9ALTE|nr:hypothetical protein [Paraglaciecola agarilytica]GAC06377.1 hypothetical protein GAGA_3544 [Paraglaciecola agarilytica NO2]